MGAAAAVAILIRKEKEIVEAFRVAGAVTPERARTPSELDIHEGPAFRILCRRAVLRPTENGKLYLDAPVWEALRSFRRRMAVVMLALVVLLGAAAAIVTYLRARP